MERNKVDVPVSYEAYAEGSRRRIRMRKRNLQERDDDFFGGQRKSAQIKVIQKFIGKLKVDAKNYEAVLAELDGLNMAKYIDEVSNIITNSVQEKEIPFYAEVATRLNSEYENVPEILIKDLTKAFNQAFEAPDDPKNRLKSVFLFTAELFVCGFSFSYKEVIEMLKKVFKSGKSKKLSHPSQIEAKLFIYWFSSNIFTAFISQFSQSFTKRTPAWINEWRQQGLEIFKLPEVLPVKPKEELTFFFVKYVSECLNLLRQAREKIGVYECELMENLKMQGELNKETEKNYNELIEKFVATKRNMLEIAAGISETVAAEELEAKIASVQEIIAKYINKAENAEIFEDEFQKEIYENVPELVTSEDKNAGDEGYKQFKPKLDNCKNVKDSNEISKAFNLINNKKNRKFLVKDCLEYRKEYHLVTPYLCRVIAIINIHYKDIGDLVNETIFSEYEKIKDTAATSFVINDKKSRFLKYICEFTKFKVVDPEKTMNCIEHLIENLQGYNLELIVAVLENVGRFLHLSEASANRFTFLMNKYENVIKKKSFPIFTSSQLTNSINLLKPRKETVEPPAPEKSEYEIKAEKAMSKCVLDEINDIMGDIDDLMKTKEGYEALQVAFMKAIENFDFINSYNYAFLLDELRHEKLSNYVVECTVQSLKMCLENRQNQKTILWSKFFAELYNYKLLERPELFAVIYDLLKIRSNEIGVINAVCNILEACCRYLDSKKVAKNNERFMLLVNFKRYIAKCGYIPMLEQFQILEVLDAFEPDLGEINQQCLEEFIASADSKMKSQGREVLYSKELDRFLSQRNLKKKEPKSSKKDSREDREPQKDETATRNGDELEKSNVTLLQEVKAFDREFNSIMETNRKDYSSRIAKPVHLEKVFDKKKEKKKEGPCITIIGRSGNKFIRKDVSKGESPQ